MYIVGLIKTVVVLCVYMCRCVCVSVSVVCLHVVLFVCLKSSSQRCKVHLYVDNNFMGTRKVIITPTGMH